MDSFFSPMAKTLNRNLLKHSAGTAIFCPQCQEVSDAKRWVLVTVGDRSLGTCTRCWDKLARGRDTSRMDIVDGREVFARAKRVKTPTDKTIWNSDGTAGPVLLCPPHTAK